ncbi:MAG: hypothetical protein AMXMBFR7_34840 [Planctomycetota bacterium]
MRLSESVYWIGGGSVGPGFTAAGDCNVYLLRGPGGYAMIDAGCGERPELIERQLAWDGVKPHEIKAIVITHAHWDHVKGANYWRERTGAKIYAPEGAAEYMLRGGQYAPDARPDGYRIDPTPPDVRIADRETFAAAGLELTAIHLPGHCAHMFGFFAELDGARVLAGGDLFYWGGKVTVFLNPDADRAVFRQSLLRLRDESFGVLLPGHRYPVMQQAQQHLPLAIEEIERQLAGQPAMRG